MSELRDAVELLRHDGTILQLFPKLTPLKSLAEFVLSCPGWPGKKIIDDSDPPAVTIMANWQGFNEARDLCLTTHASAIAKKDEDIARLKERLKDGN